MHNSFGNRATSLEKALEDGHIFSISPDAVMHIKEYVEIHSIIINKATSTEIDSHRLATNHELSFSDDAIPVKNIVKMHSILRNQVTSTKSALLGMELC